MKTKLILTVLYAFGLFAACAYGALLGSVTQTTTHKNDLQLCSNACESNEGMQKIRTSLYCTCENGASFTEDDLR